MRSSRPGLAFLLLALPPAGCEEDIPPRQRPVVDAGDAAGLDAEADPMSDCIPSNRGVEICNGIDDDCNGIIDDVSPDLEQLKQDPAHCGACRNRCEAQNARARCRAGVCGFVCNPEWNDIDGDPQNGCETKCIISNGGEEICDHIDNDCDGATDEDTNTYTEPDNCGACGYVCDLPGVAVHACEVGDCMADQCAPGFSDLNGDASDGCEYPCIPVGEHIEFCDGIDNDCDGVLDENDEDLAPPSFACANQGVCAGVEPVCEDGRWSCPYPAYPLYNEQHEEFCDGRDNDCDGEIDEDFERKGEECFRGHGICIGRGRWQCSPDHRGVRCTAMDHPELALVEVCNGRDDDCDGRVDNEVVDLAWVQVGNVRMFKYEASRPDAEEDQEGVSSGRACSKDRVLPWSNIGWEDARNACAAGGGSWRLCTVEEWRLGCGGPARTRFPYGNDFDPEACNGAGHPVGQGELLPSGSGGGACENQGYLTVDMSGNLKEWTETEAVEGGGVHFILGGAYDNRLGDSLACDGMAIPRQDGFRFPNLGFRCCSGN